MEQPKDRPLIFILYVNDLFYEIDNNKAILMYADNTLLLKGKLAHDFMDYYLVLISCLSEIVRTYIT